LSFLLQRQLILELKPFPRVSGQFHHPCKETDILATLASAQVMKTTPSESAGDL
jgi:hypothetical protein